MKFLWLLLLFPLPAQASLEAQAVALVRGQHAECSGLQIAPDRVLTAAHCLENQPQELTVHFGPNPLVPQQIVQIVGIARHPQYDPIRQTRDLALVLLAEPVTATAFLAAQPHVQQTVDWLGFGHIAGDLLGPHLRHRGQSVVEALTADRMTLTAPPQLPCQGDSGAPVVEHGHDERLLGVVVAGLAACTDEVLVERLDVATAAWAGIPLAEGVTAEGAASAGAAADSGEGAAAAGCQAAATGHAGEFAVAFAVAAAVWVRRRGAALAACSPFCPRP